MSTGTISVETFAKMFLAGAKRLESKKEWINELNVFPVPDGDTGTNMSLTIMAAAKEVAALSEPYAMEDVCKAISFGSLRGARGNSGVILSQLLRGLTKGVNNLEEIDVNSFAAAFQKAVESAYKAVMKPKEGTILTVAKGAATRAKEVAEQSDDLEFFFKEVVSAAEETLKKTPEMLPVLKQAGVVDSGGQGLVEVLKGALDAFSGKETDFDITPAATVRGGGAAGKEQIDTADIKFGYCTEFIVMLEKEYTAGDRAEFKAYLESLGDSIVLVDDEGIVKVHVHTNDPGLAIQKGLSYGSLTSMKIDNMREEHNERLQLSKMSEQNKKSEEAKAEEPKKPVGFISVSVGEGMNEIFEGLGVDYIISGGQTMNPSTEDMLNAIEHVNADTVFIFPNNKNIVMAANQARDLTEDKNIVVIPTKTVPQGITALIGFMPDRTAKENEEQMLEDIKYVKTGQVTYAVRDTNMDGVEIHQNDIMGIGDEGILSVGKEIEQTTIDMIGKMMNDDSELVSVYAGEDVSEEDMNKLEEKLTAKYTDCDFEFQYGGQPIYYYVVSVE